MDMPRIAPLESPYSPEVAEDFTRLMPPGMPPLTLFRTVAHNPRVLRRMRRGGLLDKGSITPLEREIMILRTCALCRSEYEWGVHVAFFSKTVGLSPVQVAATVNGSAEADCWNPAQRLILRLADELHASSQVSDALWAEMSKQWQPAQIIELMMLAGLYHAVSYLTNGARIPLENAAPRFPL